MGVDHILHGVGDDVTAGERIEHSIVSHGDTVIHGDGVEFGSIASHGFDFCLHNLTNLMQMCVTWDKLRKAIHDSNDGFAKLLMLHTCGDP